MDYSLFILFKRVAFFNSSVIQKSFVIAMGLLALLTITCQFNTSIPLENNIPTLLSDSVVVKTLFYPDTALCTLRVQDLNDSKLFVSTKAWTDSLHTDTFSWPGSYGFNQESNIVSKWPFVSKKTFLGSFFGRITVFDDSHDSTAMTLKVQRKLEDSLNRFPESKLLWERYSSDSSCYIFDFVKNVYYFSFYKGTDTVSLQKTKGSGIHSTFQLSGDLETSIKFQLRDDMLNGFEVGFFISTSQDTSRWAGEVAGIFITGITDFVLLTTKSYPLANSITQTTDFEGKLTIQRTGGKVSFVFDSGKPFQSPVVLSTFNYPAENSVYVHFVMKVNNSSRNRSCMWKDFSVTKGTIAF